MPDIELGIQIDEEFSSEIEEGWLRQVIEKALSVEGLSSPAELGLVITDDETVRRLNKKYRGIDEATDVLSFALLEEKEGASFVMPPDGTTHLGEVIISYPQAERQAKEQGHTTGHEVALLIIHGVLHLLGYEHNTSQMRVKEIEVLSEVES